MKTPIWETFSGALLALLHPLPGVDRTFACWDLYTITTVNGPVLRYAAADFDIAYGGNTYTSKSVRIDTEGKKATAHWKVGLDVDTWQAVFYPRAVDDLTGAAYPDLIGSVPWLQAAASGALDAATVSVDRAYFALPLPNPSATSLTPIGCYRIFVGRIAEVDLGRSGIVLSINSHLELLGIQMPRRLFQAGCDHRLFDADCTLTAAAFAATGTCAVGSTRFAIVAPLSAPAGSGTYTLGRVMMTSGANAGSSRSVRSWDGVTWWFIAPFYYAAAAGDTFVAYPGCNKSMSACAAFGNLANFSGAPFIPAPETAA